MISFKGQTWGSLLAYLAYFFLILILLIFSPLQSFSTELLDEKSKEKPQKTWFLKTDITPFQRLYLVKTAVNIRAKPLTRAKRVGTFQRLERIKGVGKAKGPWIAVRKNGKDIGFVYEKFLILILDGGLEDYISGTLKKPGMPVCEYIISFTGRTPAEGQIFKMNDYEVDWVCRRKFSKNRKKPTVQKQAGKGADLETQMSRIRFSTPMFLSEGGAYSGKTLLYQVTIDLLDMPFRTENVFSTTSFYNLKNNFVKFSGSSDNKFIKKTGLKNIKVKNVPEILKASVNLAYNSWKVKLWDDLFLKY